MRPGNVVLVLYVASVGSVAQFQQSAVRPSVEELIHTVRTGNAYQRAKAIGPLAQIEDSRVVPELAALLEDEDATVRMSVARELARLADRRSADALAGVLTDDIGDVRRYAAEGLANVGDERHVPALIASVTSHLPDPNALAGSQSWHSAPALEAISRLSLKAPPEFIALMESIFVSSDATSSDWWRLHENVARCLGQIRDRTALDALQQARRVLETGCQDYRTWYAVRKALAALDPENMAFDRPAADVINEIQWGKGGTCGSEPLTKLGVFAMEDLAWVLQFEGQQDRERVADALRALGQIGGDTAAKALRDYIERPIRPRATEDRSHASLRQFVLDTQARAREDSLCQALAALLNAMPNEATVNEVLMTSRRLDVSHQASLVATVSDVSAVKVPLEIERMFLEHVLLGSKQTGPFHRDAMVRAASGLGRIGGQRVGESLRRVLLECSDVDVATAASEALRTIGDYDAIPVLIEASRLPNTPKDAIAYAMGGIRDVRSIPALRDMMRRDGLVKEDRLWVAAALARLAVDYQDGARLIREALPDSLDQARWLHDKETITAIAAFIKPDHRQAGDARRRRYVRKSRFPYLVMPPSSVSEHAVFTLVAIGTNDVLEALTARADLEEIDDPDHVREVSAAAARIAEGLGHPARERWTTVNRIAEAVAISVSFTLRVSQQSRVGEETDEVRPEHLRAIDKDRALARKIWIAEIDRRLRNAATDARWAGPSYIHGRAVRLAELIFAPELIPSLERLAKECETSEDFRGKRAIVRYYNVRSMAAKTLTEKAGRPYTFVDADGRTRPGGWDPSQEDGR